MIPYEALLLNVLSLLIFLFFIPILLESNMYGFFDKRRSIYFTVSAAIAIVLCILFPIEIMEGYIFDLRFVALTIGGLYGGLPAMLLLSVFTVLLRALLVGGIGATATGIVVPLFLIALLLSRMPFRRADKRKRIMIGTGLSLLGTVLAIVTSIVGFGATFSASFVSIFFPVTMIVTALLIFFYELFLEGLSFQRRLLKAEKMEVVSHLAASVSHEVRNPLAAVKGFLQLIRERDLPDARVRRYVDLSLDEIDRADDIIQCYLTFAKPSIGSVESLNVKEQVDRTLQLLTPFANMFSVEIYQRVDELYVRGEEKALQQCLIGIAKYAIETMPDRGTLRIETRTAEQELLLAIIDDGNGLTEEQLARLGEPYFTPRGTEGTGLGMMVAFKVVDAMGGKLSVTSSPGQGTEYLIRLPLAGP
ncbi:ATP-binding protein [Paenibacillus sp.]|uniref:ATP-binding protein n=1 Tax=Paenibacillus sp. TaxID=58172 RepID=UPI002D404C95|nr:ATP-binding protein [Paenibacillus sp.]HZG58721.1 ATP-binding protein [Paenibacillus sp.]